MDTGRMFRQHYAVTVDTLQLALHVLYGNTAATNYAIYEGYSRRRGHSLALLRQRPSIHYFRQLSSATAHQRALLHHDLSCISQRASQRVTIWCTSNRTRRSSQITGCLADTRHLTHLTISRPGFTSPLGHDCIHWLHRQMIRLVSKHVHQKSKTRSFPN